MTSSSLIALYITLSRDMPLLKSDFSLWSEFLVDLLVDIFRGAENLIHDDIPDI